MCQASLNKTGQRRSIFRGACRIRFAMSMCHLDIQQRVPSAHGVAIRRYGDLPQLGTRRGEYAFCFPDRRSHVAARPFVDVCRIDADAQRADSPTAPRGLVVYRRTQRRGVVLVKPRHRLEHESGVRGRPRHRPDMV
jgi:hypothetical protein